MKYLVDCTALVGEACSPGLLFPHVVLADLGPVPGVGAAVGRLFTDAEIDRGCELRIRVFRLNVQADPGPLVATAAVFALDQRLFVLDVIPARTEYAGPGASVSLTPSAYRVVSNAIVDFASDHDFPIVYFPTTPWLAPPGSVPYDSIQPWYAAKMRKAIGRHRHWRVLADNERSVRLATGSDRRCSGRSVCLVHTFADLGGSGGSADLPGVVSRVIEVASRHGAPLTLCVPGSVYREVASVLAGPNPHAVAFSGEAVPGGLLRELPALRAMAADVRGYCPPEKADVPVFADRTLTHFGFDWLLQAPSEGRVPVGVHRHGVVRLTISLDDRTIPSRGLQGWLNLARAAASLAPVCLLELSGARAAYWLPSYDSVLRELGECCALRSCEDVVSDALADVCGPCGIA